MTKSTHEVGTIGYPCSGCEQTFETAEDFSNHFNRSLGVELVCDLSPKAAKKLRKP
jgi:hypothetical protein